MYRTNSARTCQLLTVINCGGGNVGAQNGDGVGNIVFLTFLIFEPDEYIAYPKLFNNKGFLKGRNEPALGAAISGR